MATRIQTTKTEGPGGSSTTSTVKTTTTSYDTSRSYETDTPTYRPNIAQRNLIIQRTSYGGPVQKQSQYTVQSSRSQALQMSPGAGAFSAVGAAGASNVRSARTKDKKDMQDLNERFASYIERVRFLEAQNHKLADELDRLKSKWGKETTAVKAMFQAELDEARKLLDEAEKEKARLQIRTSTLEQENDELRQRLEDHKKDLSDCKEKIRTQNESLSSYESEINLLQRRVESLENDREKDKKEIARLTEALNRARVDLDNETLSHIDAENRRQTLEEELEFLKQVHEQEMKELAALAYRDTTNENREFWKSELANAIREIQVTYDEKLDGMRGELETFYNLKIQEFRTGAAKNNMETVHAKEETKRLRGLITDQRAKLADLEARNNHLERELNELRRKLEESDREHEVEKAELEDQCIKKNAELAALLSELQDIMDSKLGLELEIAAYRKLLEGEENKVGLRQVVDSMFTSVTSSSSTVQSSSESSKLEQQTVEEDSNLKVSQVVKGEMSARTTYQRSAKGPLSINECAADGKYVTIENTGRREEAVGNWTIKRVIDGADKANFTFPGHIVVKPGQKVKIFAGGKPGNASASDIDANIPGWGIGANITTKLINQAAEDRATHVQRTVYTS